MEDNIIFVNDYAFNNIKLTSDYTKEDITFFGEKHEVLVVIENGDVFRFCKEK